MAAFEVSFSIRKEYKKSYWRDCLCFDYLVSWTNIRALQAIHSQEHLSLLQEVDDDLSVCVDERSPCGLSITGDIKIYQCHVIKR